MVQGKDLDLVAAVARPDLEVFAEAWALVDVHLEDGRIPRVDRTAEQLEPDGYVRERLRQLGALQGGALRVSRRHDSPRSRRTGRWTRMVGWTSGGGSGYERAK